MIFSKYLLFFSKVGPTIFRAIFFQKLNTIKSNRMYRIYAIYDFIWLRSIYEVKLPLYVQLWSYNGPYMKWNSTEKKYLKTLCYSFSVLHSRVYFDLNGIFVFAFWSLHFKLYVLLKLLTMYCRVCKKPFYSCWSVFRTSTHIPSKYLV